MMGRRSRDVMGLGVWMGALGGWMAFGQLCMAIGVGTMIMCTE